MTVCDVVESRKLMFHRVADGSLKESVVEEVVECPRRCPHQVGTSLVVIGLIDSHGCIFHNGLQHLFLNAQQHVHRLLLAEIGHVKDVRHDVCTSACRLVGTDSKSVRRVEERHVGVVVGCEVAIFLVCLHIADDTAAVHL